jgi:hypothetical protein
MTHLLKRQCEKWVAIKIYIYSEKDVTYILRKVKRDDGHKSNS